MKIGVRKPSLSKSLKARTTSKLKRQVKRAIIPTYGQKGQALLKILNVQYTIRYITKLLWMLSAVLRKEI